VCFGHLFGAVFMPVVGVPGALSRVEGVALAAGEGGGCGGFDVRIVSDNAILIDKDLIADLYAGFEKLLRFVGGLLYTASKKAGSMTAERLMRKGHLSESNALELLLWTFVASGYASKVVVEDVDVGRDTRLRLAVYDALLGSRLRGRKRPVDQPLAGFLAGWLERVYGVRVEGKEVKCASQGFDHCEFEIKIHRRMPELERFRGFEVGGCRG